MSLDTIGAGIDLVTSVVNRVWPDATQAEKDKLSFALASMTAQTDTNKTEAASTSLFVAGWRPFVGWICSASFASQFVVGPMITWGSAAFGHPVPFPTLDVATMMPLLFGLLGLGGMRTAEKINGVNAGK